MILTTPHPRSSIGLLGGSFNPAHEGHIHLSLAALDHLQLDEIWWVIAAKNPLKNQQDIAPFDKRAAFAQNLIEPYSKLSVKTIEQEKKLFYSYDTITYLMDQDPLVNFVWLMGADCWLQFHHWYRWEDIIYLLPISVFDRPGFGSLVHDCPAAQQMLPFEVTHDCSTTLKFMAPPAWMFIPIPHHADSSTQKREENPTWFQP